MEEILDTQVALYITTRKIKLILLINIYLKWVNGIKVKLGLGLVNQSLGINCVYSSGHGEMHSEVVPWKEKTVAPLVDKPCYCSTE